ncbi:AMP-binding protein [Paracoccus spongiarum]|uniref:AMP-binding protein n=1 Tax=Paracoccus spongiarum TaxID=3064387 RepID=A0ABT9JA05_9RHOB|nr:AMP-binding protein [Paracoccus sp. 2205BS29-5]MDP5306654.1 AMP-binding protein [Paracoccus sp. 2205BS29-5]
MVSQGRPMSAAGLATFAWQVPEDFNLGIAVCDHWVARDPDRIALIEVDETGVAAHHSFADLGRLAARISHVLAARGIALPRQGEVGDRVGVLLPQSLETAASHVAVTRMGGVSLPLFTLFGPEALLHRLRDSGARAIVTGAASLPLLAGIRAELPDLRLILCKNLPAEAVAGFPGIEVLDLDRACADQPGGYPAAATRADDPAILIYTSGTTGNPKGALHAHRVLLGHLPGVEVSHNLLPQPGDRLWTPADWAWIGGLLDVLLPGLYHGVGVVACRFSKFTARAALDLMRDHAIRNAFLPPTALKLMRLEPEAESWGLRLRSVASGGEPLGAELLDWGRRVFGTTINEFYGQTECNMTVSACSALEQPRPGAMGRPVPGHQVAIIDRDSGARLPDDHEGEIAVLSPDPVMFLGYWNNPDATRAKFIDGPEGRWLLTGDRGMRRADGRLVFVGRDDDVISSAGYRIGPAEIEDCLLRHPAVHLAGVVGQPDPLRGHVVAAFVTLAEGHSASDDLAAEISDHVRRHLAAYEYPRAVHFIEDMPMTTTGKIIRAALRDRAADIAARAQEAPN